MEMETGTDKQVLGHIDEKEEGQTQMNKDRIERQEQRDKDRHRKRDSETGTERQGWINRDRQT